MAPYAFEKHRMHSNINNGVMAAILFKSIVSTRLKSIVPILFKSIVTTLLFSQCSAGLTALMTGRYGEVEPDSVRHMSRNTTHEMAHSSRRQAHLQGPAPAPRQMKLRVKVSTRLCNVCECAFLKSERKSTV